MPPSRRPLPSMVMVDASVVMRMGLAQGEIVGGGVGLAFDIYVLRYFWTRRADFDIDL